MSICAPALDEVAIMHGRCPCCKKPRARFLRMSYGPYYGGDLTCLYCGDGWNEEGRKERPLYRYWRRDSIAYARKTIARYRKARELVRGGAVEWVDE